MEYKLLIVRSDGYIHTINMVKLIKEFSNLGLSKSKFLVEDVLRGKEAEVVLTDINQVAEFIERSSEYGFTSTLEDNNR